MAGAEIDRASGRGMTAYRSALPLTNAFDRGTSGSNIHLAMVYILQAHMFKVTGGRRLPFRASFLPHMNTFTVCTMRLLPIEVTLPHINAIYILRRSLHPDGLLFEVHVGHKMLKMP